MTETKEVIAFNPPTEWIKERIEAAGNTIGSVHFNKRENGELRKMSYRLHVQEPSVASKPKGLREICTVCGKEKGTCKSGPYESRIVASSSKSKKAIDEANRQITVLDANKVVRNKEGEIVGRGAWRTVPLENVVRISNRGTTYVIQRY